MKKIFTILALSAMLLSCGSDKENGIAFEKKEINFKKDNINIEVSYPMPKEKLSDELNKTFNDFEESFKQIEKNYDEIKDTLPKDLQMYTKINYEVFNNKDLDVTSILLHSETLNGGANPEVETMPININNKDKKMYNLNETLSAEKKEHILKEINNAIATKQNFDGSKIDVFDDIKIDDFSSLLYYFKDDNAVFFFPMYSIGPRATGIITFTFPKTDIL